MTPFSATPLDRCTVSIAGEVDASTVADLVAACEGFDGSATIECSHCAFIDSAGLSALLRIRQHALDAGGELRLLDPSPAVTRLLEISGLADILPVDRTADPSSAN
jgi:anti-sigma B factor antagonist